MHPAQRFSAPLSITKGVPLKDILDCRAVTLIGESFSAVTAHFDCKRFEKSANHGLSELGILERGKHLAAALAEQLPKDFATAGPLIIAALGPPLHATAGNGLAPFFYLPHSAYIAQYGVNNFALGMRANYELTQRFSAEFSLRPFLITHQGPALDLLKHWVKDRNPHVRRLVSEGTRPRLPWAMRLPAFQRDPSLMLPLLEQLKDDRELYVRRSVANHLGDIAKDHPRIVFACCSRWLDELEDSRISREIAQERRWIVRHALRLPAKHGVSQALRLRVRATTPRA